MIHALIDFSLRNRFLVLTAACLLLVWGGISFHNPPVEAYPDVANNYDTMITQWPGRAAEEVEQQVSIPIEIAMNGIPYTSLRSVSLAGLSSVTMIFDDESQNDANRAKMVGRITQLSLPAGLQPQIGTDWSRVGQIYFFTLRSANPKYDVMELKTLEDWVVERAFKSLPNVMDVASFGGPACECQVRVDPDKLVAYGLNIGQVEQQLANNVETRDGAAEIYREGSQLYVAIKYGVRAPGPGEHRGGSRAESQRASKASRRIHAQLCGEYESQQRAQRRLAIIIPLTLLFISFILYTMFRSVKWASLVLLNVARAPVGGILALFLTGANFSVFSGFGFLALFGVSVQTGVILVEYMNQLRSRGQSALHAAREGAVLRLRPIFMTMLVASLGLVPAAMSHGIGSDSQRPFAIVILGGLMAVLFMSPFLLPTLYVWFAREHDALPPLEPSPEEA